jgi:CubicO group peptidase (beta-lactamase class C family)
VVNNGEIVAAGGYGDYDPRVVRSNTVSCVCSLSKTVAAATVLSIIRQGLNEPQSLIIPLSLETRINDPRLMEPELWAKIDPWHLAPDGITIRQVLMHLSGLNNPKDGTPEPPRETGLSTDDIIWSGSVTIVSPPGSVKLYSNIGYDILAKTIEKATGKSFIENVQARVFDPLGMQSSGYNFPPTRKIRMRTQGNFVMESTFISAPPACGGLHSTAVDMAKFILGLRQIVGDDLYREMTAASPPGKKTYKLGLATCSIGNNSFYDHSGGYAPMRTYLMMVDIPNRPISGYVCIVNSDGIKTDLREVANDIFANKFGWEGCSEAMRMR